MNIILIGNKSSGKSSVGIELAEALDFDFIDLDQRMLEGDAKHNSIASLFESLGEEAFRDFELATVKKIVADKIVLATGGGTVMMVEAAKHLQTLGPIVYLHADFETLAKRNQTRDSSILKQDRDWRYEHDERDKVYRRYADIVIKTANKAVPEIVKEIKKQYEIYEWSA